MKSLFISEFILHLAYARANKVLSHHLCGAACFAE